MLFAVALTQVQGKPKEAMLGFCEGLAEVMFKFTGIVMKFAPIGIGAAIAVTVGHSGLGVLRNLGKLVLTLYGALIVFVLVVLVPVALLARMPLRGSGRAVKEPALIAFSTASSEAALPLAMERWRASACRGGSSPSSSRPATRSTSTARRSTWRGVGVRGAGRRAST